MEFIFHDFVSQLIYAKLRWTVLPVLDEFTAVGWLRGSAQCISDSSHQIKHLPSTSTPLSFC